MKRQTWSGMLIAGIFAVSGVVMAQSPATSSSPSQTPSTSAPSATQATPSASPSSSADKVTVTGCLREASASPAATSGSSTPSATDAKTNTGTDPKFVVADAVPSSGSTSVTSAPQTYLLIANDSALAPHVGKKLQFTGTIESKEAAATGQPRLRVEAASVVGSDCSK